MQFVSQRFAAVYKIRRGILNISDLFYTHDNSYLLVRSCPQFKVKKDKLLYKNGKEVWVEVVTNKSLQMEILQASHTAGHLRRTKAYYNTSERYYWPGIYKHVMQFVSQRDGSVCAQQ